MQFGNRIAIGKIIAIVVGDRDVDHRTGLVARCIIAVRRSHAQRYGATDVFQPRIAQQGTGQQTGFGQHLKAVADPHDITATLRMGRHFATDRRIRRNGTTAQVVAIGKAAGHTHNIDALGQARVLVPDHRHFGTDRLECHRQIAVTVRAGKNDDRCVHQLISTV